jgi:predicted MPP superfamily phosphohydrolase
MSVDRRPGRRRFLRLAAASMGAAAGLGGYTAQIEPYWLELVRRPLRLRNLPPALIGRTLAHISDIHVGTRVDDEYLVETFQRVHEVRPDIVVLTGDFISYHTGVFDQLAAVCRHYPHGRLATLAVLGNHDYGPGWSHPELAQQVIDTVRPLGITVLRNEICDVEGFQIAGLDDWWAKQFMPEPVLARLDPKRAAIVLTHNPDTVDLPVWGHYAGWILAGHTHGGQCRPPFLPPPLLPVLNPRYTSGEFVLSGNRRLYISRGVGHLLRVRFNVRPEVTVFDLSSTSSPAVSGVG